MKKVKVLIVDDSAVVRQTLSQILGSDPQIEVMAPAADPFIAAERIRLRHSARHGDRRARLVLNYARNPEYFLSIVLVGTNLGMIGCTATFTAPSLMYSFERSL